MIVANDCREVYRLVRGDADFDAAIFDMMMPHLEGIDLIRHMNRKRLSRIPVMMIPLSEIPAHGGQFRNRSRSVPPQTKLSSAPRKFRREYCDNASCRIHS